MCKWAMILCMLVVFSLSCFGCSWIAQDPARGTVIRCPKCGDYFSSKEGAEMVEHMRGRPETPRQSPDDRILDQCQSSEFKACNYLKSHMRNFGQGKSIRPFAYGTYKGLLYRCNITLLRTKLCCKKDLLLAYLGLISRSTLTISLHSFEGVAEL